MDSSDQKRIVIKIGTHVLTQDDGVDLHHARIAGLTHAIADLNKAGHECLVVSSGAVGAGLATFQLDARPEDIGMLQACAAAGQARLMHVYESQFSNYSLKVAQLLVTHEDLNADDRRVNVHTTLTRLLDFPKVIPIINENDSVAVYELKVGDNDLLSADIARLIDADQLIMLTSVPGLRRPDSDDPNDIVTEVEDIETVLDFADGESGRLSVGGMATKLQAVKNAVDAGIETVIASGRNPDQLSDLVSGGGIGTRFRPRVLLA
ncbi:MAG: glutamate 5-kinase [Verrucomicrobiales bacterium]|nr:glutamate 5-kinase [Verrucomicrobiales bacterium]